MLVYTMHLAARTRGLRSIRAYHRHPSSPSVRPWSVARRL